MFIQSIVLPSFRKSRVRTGYIPDTTDRSGTHLTPWPLSEDVPDKWCRDSGTLGSPLVRVLSVQVPGGMKRSFLWRTGTAAQEDSLVFGGRRPAKLAGREHDRSPVHQVDEYLIYFARCLA
jgi:hypothetical protein